MCRQVRAAVGSCGGQNNAAPPHTPLQMPRTCEYATLHGNTHLADELKVKTVEMADDPGSSGCTQCNHMSPYKLRPFPSWVRERGMQRWTECLRYGCEQSFSPCCCCEDRGRGPEPGNTAASGSWKGTSGACRGAWPCWHRDLPPGRPTSDSWPPDRRDGTAPSWKPLSIWSPVTAAVGKQYSSSPNSTTVLLLPGGAIGASLHGVALGRRGVAPCQCSVCSCRRGRRGRGCTPRNAKFRIHSDSKDITHDCVDSRVTTEVLCFNSYSFAG